MTTLPVFVGEFAVKDNTHWVPEEGGVEWDKFCKHPVTYTPHKHKVASYVIGTIVQSERAKCSGRDDCNGYHRTNVAVVERYAITLDADFLAQVGDGDGEKLLRNLADLGIAALAYDTHSSAPGAMRLRIVVPINRGVNPTEYRAIARHLMRELGWDGEDGDRFGPFDKGGQQHSRLMYLQAAPKGRKTFRKKFPGPFLDADEWVMTADLSEPQSLLEPPERPPVDTASPPSDWAVEKALSILQTYAGKLAASSEGVRNDYLIEVLPTLYRFELGGCYPKGHVDEVMEPAAEVSGIDTAEYADVSGNAWGYAIGDGADRPAGDVGETFDAVAEDEPVVGTVDGDHIGGDPQCRAKVLEPDGLGWTRCAKTNRIGKWQGDPWYENTCEEHKDVPVTELVEVRTTDLEAEHRAKVEQQLERMRIRDEARRLFLAEQRGERAEPVAPTSLAALLDEPEEEVPWLVAGLWPKHGRVVFAAQHKSGKTTGVVNLIKCLADGGQFLDRYEVEAVARVVLIDNEMPRHKIRQWLREQGIANAEAVDVVPLRGMVSSFDLADQEVRSKWAKAIGEADVLIFDCLRPVLDALGMSEDKDAGRFLTLLSELCGEAGIGSLMVVHHMGHNGERARGDSAILGWPDANWTLVRETEDQSSPRYFSAYGRDVDVPEGRLAYDPDGRWTSWEGGSRSAAKQSRQDAATGFKKAELRDAIVAVVDDARGKPLSKSKIAGMIQANRNKTFAAVDELTAEGVLVGNNQSGWRRADD